VSAADAPRGLRRRRAEGDGEKSAALGGCPPKPNAQLYVHYLGEYSMVDTSGALDMQSQTLVSYMPVPVPVRVPQIRAVDRGLC
jgi:hypothetical protein